MKKLYAEKEQVNGMGNSVYNINVSNWTISINSTSYNGQIKTKQQPQLKTNQQKGNTHPNNRTKRTKLDSFTNLVR